MTVSGRPRGSAAVSCPILSVARGAMTDMALSPHHTDVFSHLPVLLMRELDTPVVASLVQRLLDAGWRSGQLRHRVGGAPSQGSPERDAAHLAELLRGLTAVVAPDIEHAEQLRRREADQAQAARDAPPAATPEVRDQHLAAMRAELGVAPRRRADPEPRTRPACSLCDGEGAFFVTHEVHLCGRCVAALATGEARLSQTG